MPIGSNFDDFLKQQGIYEIACASAVAKAQMLEAKDRTKLRRHWIMVSLLVTGLLVCCLLVTGAALAQTPEPTAIKYPDATGSPAVKAAFTQALEKCQAEVREDYASKMAKAVADGKPHLVPVYERRRDSSLVDSCQLRADTAGLKAGNVELKAGNVELTAGNAELKAGNAELKAGNAELKAGNVELKAGNVELKAGNVELKAGNAALNRANTITEKIANQKATTADIAELRGIHTDLKKLNISASNPELQMAIAAIGSILDKQKRL